MIKNDAATQSDLFSIPLACDLQAGREARDAALAQVAAGADAAFVAQALLALDRVARQQLWLGVDDVWSEMSRSGLIAPTRDRRVMGSIMLQGRRALLITACGGQPSTQKQCHAGPRTKWRSLVYDE
jgi:hypothetical protein